MKSKKKENTLKLRNFQKKFTIVGLVGLLCLWVFSFFAKISLSSMNVEVERLSNSVKKQEKVNQGLVMKINELASLENIQEVANQEGLAYNNNNIVIIKQQ